MASKDQDNGNTVTSNGNPERLGEDAESKPIIDKGGFSYDKYATTKTVSQSMLNLTLLVANIKQIILLSSSDPISSKFVLSKLVFLGIAVFLQVIVGFAMVWLGKMKLAEPRELDTAMRAMDESKAPTFGVLESFQSSGNASTQTFKKNARADIVNKLLAMAILAVMICNMIVQALGK